MNTMNKPFCRNRKCFFFPLLILSIFAVSAIVMLLWNWIIPGISNLSPLSYWQAMGLLLLCRILFSGLHFKRHHTRGIRHAHFAHAAFKDKFMDLTVEEKQKFKDQWKSRCCKTPNT